MDGETVEVLQLPVGSPEEAEQLRSGLDDPTIRAVVRIIGILRPLKREEQTRVLKAIEILLFD